MRGMPFLSEFCQIKYNYYPHLSRTINHVVFILLFPQLYIPASQASATSSGTSLRSQNNQIKATTKDVDTSLPRNFHCVIQRNKGQDRVLFKVGSRKMIASQREERKPLYQRLSVHELFRRGGSQGILSWLSSNSLSSSDSPDSAFKVAELPHYSW